MQKENIESIVKEFCNAIKDEFSNDIKVEYKYDGENDFWTIWHNYKDFADIKFRKKVGKNIIKYFFNNNLTNTSFAYNSALNENALNIYDYSTITQLSIWDIDREYDAKKAIKATFQLKMDEPNIKYNIEEEYNINNLNKEISFYLPSENYIGEKAFDSNINLEQGEVFAA